MANDSIVANLFGLDPELLYQKQQEDDTNYGFKMAQLSPEQAAAAPVFSMTQKLGRQVGNLLGIEDPQMAKNSKIMAVKKQAKAMGLDPMSADGMVKYAQLLSEAGLDDVAMQAQAKATEMQKTQGEINWKKAQTAEELSKIAGNQRKALGVKEISPDDFTPESIQKFMQGGGKDYSLLVPSNNIKSGTHFETNEGVLVYDPKSYEANPAIRGSVPGFVRAGSPVDRSTKVQVNTGDVLPEFTKELQKKDAGSVSKLEEDQARIRASFDKIDALENLYEKGNLIKGALPDMRLGVAQFFDTFGLGTDKLKASIGDTSTFQAAAGDMVMGMLGGTLGSQVSDADRKFAERMKPMLAQGQGIEDVIKYVRQRAREEAAKNRGELDRLGARNGMKPDRDGNGEYEEAYKAQEIYRKDPAGTLQKAWDANPQVHGKMSMEEFAKAYVRALDKKTRKHI